MGTYAGLDAAAGVDVRWHGLSDGGRRGECHGLATCGAAFSVGAVLGGRAVPHRTERVLPRSTVVTLGVVTVVVAVTCAGWLLLPHPGRPALLVGIGVLAGSRGHRQRR